MLKKVPIYLYYISLYIYIYALCIQPIILILFEESSVSSIYRSNVQDLGNGERTTKRSLIEFLYEVKKY